MCTFSTPSEKVKILGYFDLVITITTIFGIGYGVILPYSPYNNFTTLEKTPNIVKPLPPFPFWSSVGIFGTLGSIAILWSLVLVKTSKLEATRDNEKHKMLGYWLLGNGFLVFILTCLLLFVVTVSNTLIQQENVFATVVVMISCGGGYLFRIVLVLVVWRVRRNFSWEREMTCVGGHEWEGEVQEKSSGQHHRAPFYYNFNKGNNQQLETTNGQL